MSAPVQPVIMRLREASSGRDIWRVQDKDDKSYCIEFERWEKHIAERWWNDAKDEEWNKNRELVLVRVYTQADRLMQEAADMLESMETVYDPAELEREYQETKPESRRFRPFDFVDAMRLIDEGWNAWAAKPHNKKWSCRVEGTPIRNDLTCAIAHAIIDAQQYKTVNPVR